MMIWSRIFAAAALGSFLTLATNTQGASSTVWTAIIPKGFPHSIYTWRLGSDGRYSEDGRDASSGGPVQPKLSGRWRRTGAHLVLRQDGIAYVFDGNIVGDEYRGLVYLDGKRFSRFCALRGEKPPLNCPDISA